VAYAKARYGADFATFRKVYRLPPSVTGWADVASFDFDGLKRTARVVADDVEFLSNVAEKYFRLAATSIRKPDPAGLVFGQRFLSEDCPLGVLAAAGRWFDVISVQPSVFGSTTERVQHVIARLINISRQANNTPSSSRTPRRTSPRPCPTLRSHP